PLSDIDLTIADCRYRKRLDAPPFVDSRGNAVSRTISDHSRQLQDLPMFRHIAQPLHAGGFEADVGVEAAGDGAVDDGLLLLLQQLDQLLLGADVPPNPPVRVVEEADDGGLFGKRGE